MTDWRKDAFETLNGFTDIGDILWSNKKESPMTDLEINKICHKIITGGKGCFHKWKDNGYCYHETCISCGTSRNDKGARMYKVFNPDYLNNKSDAYDLIQFVMNEWEDWLEFILKIDPAFEYISVEARFIGGQLSICKLFKTKRALPTAVAEYEKGKEEE